MDDRVVETIENLIQTVPMKNEEIALLRNLVGSKRTYEEIIPLVRRLIAVVKGDPLTARDNLYTLCTQIEQGLPKEKR